MQALGSPPPPGTPSGALDVSPDGEFIVGASQSPPGFQSEAFRRTPDGVMTGLGALPTLLPYERRSQANAVSRGGAVVVGYSSSLNGSREAFRWTATGGMVGMGDLPGGDFHSEATGVSADGSVIVGAGTVQVPDRIINVPQAFRWTADGGMKALAGVTDLPVEYTGASDVSADGKVVVGYSSGEQGTVVVRWVDGVPQNLGHLPGVGTIAMATNGDGSVVIGSTDNRDDVFVWDEAHGIRSVTALLRAAGVLPEGWRLQGAAGLSADGRTLAGFGRNPDNFQEAFVITIPEPAAAAALAVAWVPIMLRGPRRGDSRRSIRPHERQMQLRVTELADDPFVVGHLAEDRVAAPRGLGFEPSARRAVALQPLVQ
jgi:probable HAF family extracellular repeat protein